MSLGRNVDSSGFPDDGGCEKVSSVFSNWRKGELDGGVPFRVSKSFSMSPDVGDRSIVGRQ